MCKIYLNVMKRILGIGNAVTDIPVVLPDKALLRELGLVPGSMNHVDAPAARKIWEKIQGMDLGNVPGGSAANTVAAAARLGMGGGFIGKVGRDKVGELYGRAMEDDGVRAYLTLGSHPSARAVTFITPPDGERTFATYLGAALELSAADLREEMFEGYDYLHVEGYLMQCGDVVERAVEIARGKGIAVSFDLGSCGIVRNYHERVCRIVADYADIVFANEQEAEAISRKGGEEALRWICSLMASERRVAVVKLGKEGSLVMAGGSISVIGAMPARAVDTTGAGDAYAAGFLYAHSCGADPALCGETGAMLASRVVEAIGPKMEERGWDEVLFGIKAKLE